MRVLARVPPNSVEELKATGEGFADSLHLDEVFKTAENIKKRANINIKYRYTNRYKQTTPIGTYILGLLK